MSLQVGLDLGSLFCKVAIIDKNDTVLYDFYEPHQGNPLESLKKAFHKIPADLLQSEDLHLCVTGANADLLTARLHLESVDTIRAIAQVVRKTYPDARNIIDIGGGSATLIQLDEEGNFRRYTTNSLCAAGTGSFLDEQAQRLNVSITSINTQSIIEHPPPIASRCSVFAKSDLIHRQQQGYSKEAMWSGLCKSMSDTLIQTLLKGKPLEGVTVVTGGVSQNHEVIHWLKKRFADQIITFPTAHLVAAIGAAHHANGRPIPQDVLNNLFQVNSVEEKQENAFRKPLQLLKSKYPDFSVSNQWVNEDDCEIRITKWQENISVKGYMGVDIGSTSTKLILIDEEGNVLADIYTKTAGEPINAVRKLFKAVQDIASQYKSNFEPLGVGTTGSGRKMIGHIIGADVVVNEITAHVTGAMKVDPSVDTIFEIGGQDSKYMRTRNGYIFDSNMNYACAAGTGSFVEELARKLGFNIQDVGDEVMGVVPPPTSDRCTVFMEQDVMRLIRQGYSKTECMAGVLYSVIQNYLTKVVGHRHISDTKIFFQGATARNKGLVAAIENLLDVEIVVSPYCHVMGSYGVALLTRDHLRATKGTSQFLGLDLSSREVTIHEETCRLCSNLCTISYAHVQGLTTTPSWGYMCGREPDDHKMKAHHYFDAFKTREKIWKTFTLAKDPNQENKAAVSVKTIGIPQALTTYTYLPLWRTFFQELGQRIKLSGKTTQEVINKGIQTVGADFCFPIKIIHGAVQELIEDDTVDYVFVPNMIGDKKTPLAVDNKFCPYVEAAPDLIRTAMTLNHLPVDKMLSPVVDLKFRDSLQVKELFKVFRKSLDVRLSDVKRAWHLALEAFNQYESQVKSEGEKALERIAERDEPAIVIIGRPYNTYDLGSNIGLPQKISDKGMTVVPVDMIPFDKESYNSDYFQMYWNYGQRIISALDYVKDHPNLYAVYFTNFSCGPDSFLLSYAEKIMGEKPFLILEIDEHGADTGYMTRVEAFLDVVNRYEFKKQETRIYSPTVAVSEYKKRKIWIPPMHGITKDLFAAAFRAWGYDCEALPTEDREALEYGQKYIRGGECLPTALTIGALLKKLHEVGAGKEGKEHAFFMPTAEGPCRFGQYSVLHRMVLNRAGFKECAILSPSSRNAYQGLEEPLRKRLWDAILIGDILMKMTCKIRPYEIHKGDTDAALDWAVAHMCEALESNDRKRMDEALAQIVQQYRMIPVQLVEKPLVGVVGEIYIRCDGYANEEVIRAIEEYGGEAWLIPISEWILYSNDLQEWLDYKLDFNLGNLAMAKVKNFYFAHWEHHYYDIAEPILHDRHEPPIRQVIDRGETYVPYNFEGEAILTLGRAVLFHEQQAELVVNCAPFGCMPGAVSTAIFQKIEQDIGMPIVNMFYDGEGRQNQQLKTYIGLIKQRLKEETPT